MQTKFGRMIIRLCDYTDVQTEQLTDSLAHIICSL